MSVHLTLRSIPEMRDATRVQRREVWRRVKERAIRRPAALFGTGLFVGLTCAGESIGRDLGAEFWGVLAGMFVGAVAWSALLYGAARPLIRAELDLWRPRPSRDSG